MREYYHILEDTFIGFMIPAWTKTVKRKALSTAKFYYFDLGIKNTLAQIKHLEPQSDLYLSNTLLPWNYVLILVIAANILILIIGSQKIGKKLILLLAMKLLLKLKQLIISKLNT